MSGQMHVAKIIQVTKTNHFRKTLRIGTSKVLSGKNTKLMKKG